MAEHELLSRCAQRSVYCNYWCQEDLKNTQCLSLPQVFYKRGDVPDLRPYEVKLVETKCAPSLTKRWWGAGEWS